MSRWTQPRSCFIINFTLDIIIIRYFVVSQAAILSDTGSNGKDLTAVGIEYTIRPSTFHLGMHQNI